MTKRCRRCIHRRTMEGLVKAGTPDWAHNSRRLPCLNCRRFPKIRKMHPDNFEEKPK